MKNEILEFEFSFKVEKINFEVLSKIFSKGLGILAGVLISFVVIGIGLGVGLGVGLNHHSSSSTLSSDSGCLYLTLKLF